MVEIKTSQGPIVVRIPMLDENVQEMVRDCRRILYPPPKLCKFLAISFDGGRSHA